MPPKPMNEPVPLMEPRSWQIRHSAYGRSNKDPKLQCSANPPWIPIAMPNGPHFAWKRRSYMAPVCLAVGSGRGRPGAKTRRTPGGLVRTAGGGGGGGGARGMPTSMSLQPTPAHVSCFVGVASAHGRVFHRVDCEGSRESVSHMAMVKTRTNYRSNERTSWT